MGAVVHGQHQLKRQQGESDEAEAVGEPKCDRRSLGAGPDEGEGKADGDDPCVRRDAGERALLVGRTTSVLRERCGDEIVPAPAAVERRHDDGRQEQEYE